MMRLIRAAYRSMPRFPIAWMLGNPRIEGFVVKAVWFVIPLEYYLVTSFSAGFPRSAFGAAAMFTLLYVVLLFGISCILAFFGDLSHYERRLRIWSVALIVAWGTTVALVAAAYFSNNLKERRNDLIAEFICKKVWRSCVPEYPAFSAQTLLIYVLYSSLAIVVLLVVSRRKKRALRDEVDWYVPDVLLVALINAVAMTAMHAYANSG